jgi:hypothetical protein
MIIAYFQNQIKIIIRKEEEEILKFKEQLLIFGSLIIYDINEDLLKLKRSKSFYFIMTNNNTF